MLGKPKKIINIVIEDYVIRFVESVGDTLSATNLLKEKPLPVGVIIGGKIVDEIKFFEFMKELVKECGIKHRRVRFYVPSALVIMRQVEFPTDVKGKDIKDYISVEIGQSIHLPFKDPVFDIHYDDGHLTEDVEMRKGTMFAAPEEEVRKFMDVFDDVSLKPIVADVRAIGVYRYFKHKHEVEVEKTYIFVELNLDSFNLSIFYKHQLEFLRYQTLDLKLKGWDLNDENSGQISWSYVDDDNKVLEVVDDQIVELERIMNFYTFSVKKDESHLYELVLLGDHPLLNEFHQKVLNQFDLPTKLLKGIISKNTDMGPKYIPALGLALKGGVS